MIVSVVLPFRNAEATLAEAIQSILDQTFTDFELILVDNGSTDGSNELARSFADDRIKLVAEPKIGVIHAANLGMKVSSGQFIARMDVDDWSFPYRLESQVHHLKEYPQIDVVSGLVESLKPPLEGFRNYLDWLNQVGTTEDVYLNQFVEYPIVNPSVMFRRTVYETHGGYESGDFPEDYEFFLRLMKAGIKMSKVDRPVLRWNDLPTRLTRTSPHYSEQAFNKVKSKYLADWLKNNNSFHPDIWVWGAGKQARHKSAELEKFGIQILGFIDVNDKVTSGTRPVFHFSGLPKIPDRFIVSYVSNWGARDEIRSYLMSLGWTDGQDFVLAG